MHAMVLLHVAVGLLGLGGEGAPTVQKSTNTIRSGRYRGAFRSTHAPGQVMPHVSLPVSKAGSTGSLSSVHTTPDIIHPTHSTVAGAVGHAVLVGEAATYHGGGGSPPTPQAHVGGDGGDGSVASHFTQANGISGGSETQTQQPLFFRKDGESRDIHVGPGVVGPVNENVGKHRDEGKRGGEEPEEHWSVVLVKGIADIVGEKGKDKDEKKEGDEPKKIKSVSKMVKKGDEDGEASSMKKSKKGVEEDGKENATTHVVAQDVANATVPATPLDAINTTMIYSLLNVTEETVTSLIQQTAQVEAAPPVVQAPVLI